MIQPRRYQRGSVYKTGRTKTWYGMYREDVHKMDGSLTRRQRNIRLGTFSELPTKSAAAAKLLQLITTSKPNVEMTFADLFKAWTEAIVPTLKPQTASYYRKLLETHVMPVFGSVQIVGITRHDISVFLAGKATEDYSRSTLKGMRVSMSLLLEYAVNLEMLEKNSARGVKLPQALTPARTRRVLTPNEIMRIASKLTEPYATLFLFLAATGLRIGEACAVRWSSIDAEGVLHVTEQTYEGVVGSLKSKASARDLPLPASLLDRMKTLRREEPVGDNGEQPRDSSPATDWVFGSRNGTPLNAGNVRKRFLYPAARAVGIELTGWHDLRHSATTNMIRDGVAINTVSKLMGHSNPNITLAVYDHPNFQDFRAPLKQMSAQLL